MSESHFENDSCLFLFFARRVTFGKFLFGVSVTLGRVVLAYNSLALLVRRVFIIFFEKLIGENKNGNWIDGFIEFRETWEFAPSAKEVMKKFDALRAEHDQNGDKIYDEAKELFEKDDKDAAYQKCERIVSKYYASKRYRYAKKKLAERDLASKEQE